MLLRRLWRFARPQKHCVGMAAQCAAVPAVSSPPKRGKRTKPGEAINAAKSRNSARPRRARGETKASLWGCFGFMQRPSSTATKKGATTRETTRALRHFQTCRPRGGVFLDCPCNPLCHAQKTFRRFTPHPPTPALSCSAATTKPATRQRHSAWFAPKTPPGTRSSANGLNAGASLAPPPSSGRISPSTCASSS